MPLSPFPCSRCTFPDRKRQKKLSTTLPFHSFFFYFFCVIKQNNLFLRVKRWAQIRLSVRAQGSGSTPLSTDVTRESVHRFGFFPTLTGLTESMINGVKFAVHTEPATIQDHKSRSLSFCFWYGMGPSMRQRLLLCWRGEVRMSSCESLSHPDVYCRWIKSASKK